VALTDEQQFICWSSSRHFAGKFGTADALHRWLEGVEAGQATFC
jgi:hypothetical protein